MTKYEMIKIIQKTYVSMQLNELLPLEQYDIYLKEDFNSAAWYFDENKHKIVIGTDIFVNKKELNQTQKQYYLKSFLFHEFAHSIWTEKELNKINHTLKENNISFTLFNLFEDARIEEKMRKHHKRAFKWLSFETITEPNNPLEIFFFLVQSECNIKQIKRLKNSFLLAQLQEFETVLKFYKKILKCFTIEQIIEILKEWYRVFPKTKTYLKAFEEEKHFVVTESSNMNHKNFETLLENSIEIIYEGAFSASSILQHSRHDDSLPVKHSSTTTLLHDKKVAVEFSQYKKELLLQEMEKIFVSPSRTINTNYPSKRLNIKAISCNSDKLFRKKLLENRSKKHITLILDLSGSMQETIADMRLFVDVINTMVLKQYITATLLLSGVKFAKAYYEEISMPLSRETLERIVAKYEAEGLENCMQKNLALLQKSDYIWILTDGYIDEKPVKKSFFQQKGIYTYALYIGNESVKEQMKKSFDSIICKKDIQSLAKEVFALIK